MISILAFFLMVGAEAKAQSVESILVQIDQYLGSQNFSNAYVVGDLLKTTMTAKSENESSEITTIQEVTATVPEISLQLKSSKEGHLIRTDQFSQDQWNVIRGNYVRALLNQFTRVGFEVQLQIIDFSDYRMIVNNRPRRISGIKIAYFGKNNQGSKLTGELIVTNQLPGPAQIPYRKEIQDKTSRSWKIFEFDRTPPGYR